MDAAFRAFTHGPSSCLGLTEDAAPSFGRWRKAGSYVMAASEFATSWMSASICLRSDDAGFAAMFGTQRKQQSRLADAGEIYVRKRPVTTRAYKLSLTGEAKPLGDPASRKHSFLNAMFSTQLPKTRLCAL
ncbi:hypothetical protein ACN47E_007242 [Coniothyrium glycines]